jgi:hypothetical protein
MAILNTHTKQPAEELDYDIEYVDFLSAGDSLLSGTASVSPAGLTVHAPLVVGTGLKVWVSGGSAGTSYKVTVRATTVLGRIKEDELVFKIKEY